MENNKKPKWITTSHFNFDFFSFSSACESYQTSMKELLGFPFNYKYNNLDIYYDDNNFIAHENMLNNSLWLIKEQIDFIEAMSGNLVTASKKYGGSADLEDFESWWKIYIEFLPTLGIVVAPERVLVKRLRTFLSEDDFQKISFSDETSTARESNALLEIAALSHPDIGVDKLIDDHIEKFGWLGNKWMTFNPFTSNDIWERLGTIGDKAAEKIRSVTSTREKMEKDLMDVVVGLSDEQRFFVDQYRRLLYWRTGRGEAAAFSCSLTLPLFTSIAGRIGLDRKQVVRYSFREINEFIKNNEKAESPEARKYFDAVMIDGDLQVEWRAEEVKRDITRDAPAKQFSGVVASKGKARGLVMIINDTPDIKDFKKGYVLVAASTNPNMVTAMEKAAAFITDVGGLTSHAAIISRELDVPCIIDTKIATKTLKNGDLVEVDANNGIVTILDS